MNHLAYSWFITIINTTLLLMCHTWITLTCINIHTFWIHETFHTFTIIKGCSWHSLSCIYKYMSLSPHYPKNWYGLIEFSKILGVSTKFTPWMMAITLNSLIEDGLVFNFWTFGAILYSCIFRFLLNKSLRYFKGFCWLHYDDKNTPIICCPMTLIISNTNVNTLFIRCYRFRNTNKFTVNANARSFTYKTVTNRK